MVKKQVKFVVVFWMLLMSIVILCSVKTKAATSISLSDLPAFPENGQKYWVIFTEGYRDSRVELTTCDISVNANKAWIKWDMNMTLQGADSVGEYNQYYLNDNNEWEQIGTWYEFTSYATSVIASNLDVKDADGRLCVAKTKLDGYPEGSSVKYKITYNANGGDNAPNSQKFVLGKKVKISSQKPVRNGYIFKGWSKSSKATEVNYYSGKSYVFKRKITLYAVWEPICTNNKNITNLDKRKKKSAVLLANKFAKEAKSTNGALAPSARQQLKELKNQVKVTGYNKKVPDEVIEAFAQAVLDSLKVSNVDKYETNTNKLTLQIYNQIKSGIRNKKQKIKIGRTVYTVRYQIMAQSYGNSGAQVSWADVSWRDKNNKLQSAYIVSNSTNEGMKKSMASYCAVLAQLNKGIWKDFLTKYVTDGWKLADLNQIKKLDDKTVSRFFDHSENLILVICGDKQAKKQFLNDASGTLKEQLSKMTQKQFREFIKKNVPNSDKIINAADQYKKISDKYNYYRKYLKKWKQTGNDNDLYKCQKAYDECQRLINSFDNMLR